MRQSDYNKEYRRIKMNKINFELQLIKPWYYSEKFIYVDIEASVPINDIFKSTELIVYSNKGNDITDKLQDKFPETMKDLIKELENEAEKFN